MFSSEFWEIFKHIFSEYLWTTASFQAFTVNNTDNSFERVYFKAQKTLYCKNTVYENHQAFALEEISIQSVAVNWKKIWSSRNFYAWK